MTEARCLRFEDFLTIDERSELPTFVRDHQAELVTSTVNPAGESAHEVDSSYRRSRVLFDLGPIRAMFDDRLAAVSPPCPHGVGRRLVRARPDRGPAHGPRRRRLLRSPHRLGRTRVATRIGTFVCYFAMRRHAFSGGDLRLYDNVEREGVHHPAETFTTIEPRDNSIVFFPSTSFQEVMPVHTADDRLDHHRFTANGWFHVATAADSGAPGADPT